MRLTELEKKIEYTFQNTELLHLALTHTSYANETKMAGNHNERLEFLGDSILSVIVSEYLYKTQQKQQEGKLTKVRAALVNEKALFTYAQKINLGNYLYLGKGEEQNGGRERPSICADAFEALIAAIYLDGGYSAAKAFVLPFAEHALTNLEDYKTLLQEIVQQNPGERLRYVTVNETGPDHDKSFDVEVHLNSNVIGKGTGHSKKEAEQGAAKEALELMGLI